MSELGPFYPTPASSTGEEPHRAFFFVLLFFSGPYQVIYQVLFDSHTPASSTGEEPRRAFSGP